MRRSRNTVASVVAHFGPLVRREVAPASKVAPLKPGLVPEIKSHFTKTPDGYIVALAIPKAQLAPLSLTPGTAFNFAVIVNDNDNDYRKRGLVLTPYGVEPFTHPEVYPTVVLGR